MVAGGTAAVKAHQPNEASAGRCGKPTGERAWRMNRQASRRTRTRPARRADRGKPQAGGPAQCRSARWPAVSQRNHPGAPAAGPLARRMGDDARIAVTTRGRSRSRTQVPPASLRGRCSAQVPPIVATTQAWHYAPRLQHGGKPCQLEYRRFAIAWRARHGPERRPAGSGASYALNR